MALFSELTHRLEKAENTGSVIDWLEERRTTFQPLRMKMRALLRKEPHVSSDNPVAKFNKGMWGLMRGGVSLLEAGHGQTKEYGFGGHTVLDMMMQLRKDDISEARDRYLQHARGQRMAMERAWQDVVAGYVELKHRSLLP